MKRIVIASLLGLFALPALAASQNLPFEQTQFDRTQPTVAEVPMDKSASWTASEDHNRYNP